jgi:hypothetical protein
MMSLNGKDFLLMGKQALINKSNGSIALLEKINCSHRRSLKPELILGNQNLGPKMKIGHENVMKHEPLE